MAVMSCGKASEDGNAQVADSATAQVEEVNPLLDSLKKSIFTPTAKKEKAECPENKDGEFAHYKETEECSNAEIVYCGRSDYYIVDAVRGYAIMQVYGGFLDPTHWLRGDFNSRNTEYILDKTTGREIRVIMEEVCLTEDRAIDWMGIHRKLDFDDQETYDAIND